MNQVRHDITGNSFIIVFIIISLLIMFTLFEEFKPVNTTNYKQVTIEQGDTLWSLADTYGKEIHKNHEQFINWVERVNQITPENIKPGQKIVIPIKS